MPFIYVFINLFIGCPGPEEFSIVVVRMCEVSCKKKLEFKQGVFFLHHRSLYLVFAGMESMASVISVCISAILPSPKSQRWWMGLSSSGPHSKQRKGARGEMTSSQKLDHREKQKYPQKLSNIIQHMSHWPEGFQMATFNSKRSLG